MSRGLLTTTVGSFPKPDYLQKARNQYAAGRLSREELAELERRATREVIALQEEVGLDILVDGEMYRGDMVAYFAELLEGMAIGGLVRSYGNRYYHKPVITGALGWPGPMTLEMWRFAQSLTEKPVKGILTGPYTMVEWSFNDYYDDRRRMILDMALATRQEAMALDRAGALYIQVDEPALSTRLEDLNLAIEAMSVVTQGLRAKTISHMCYGDFASAYPRFLDLPVQQFDMETANGGYDLTDLLKGKGFPADRELAWGVIDVHNHLVETPEQVMIGIRKGLEVLPPERLHIDPDCGLKTRTAEEAGAKLRVMMEGVRRVRKELGLEQ